MSIVFLLVLVLASAPDKLLIGHDPETELPSVYGTLQECEAAGAFQAPFVQKNFGKDAKELSCKTIDLDALKQLPPGTSLTKDMLHEPTKADVQRAPGPPTRGT
jgi:hypothetical protein